MKASGGLLSECSVGDPEREVEACVALVCASTDDGRPLTGGINLIWAVVDWVASGSRPCKNTNTGNLAHDFGVKLSPCMCSHISCPGWRNGWHM